MLSGVGYEGRDPDELVEELREAGVDVVVDARLHAVSRRRGFSKRALADVLARNGIDYVHEPSLGNPVENRDAFRRRATREAGRERYRDLVGRRGAAALERVRAQARSRNVALLCVERDADTCHRAVLLDLLGGA